MSKSRTVKMTSLSTTLGGTDEGGKKIGGSKIHRWGHEGSQYAEAHCDCGWKSIPCPEASLPEACPKCGYRL